LTKLQLTVNSRVRNFLDNFPPCFEDEKFNPDSIKKIGDVYNRVPTSTTNTQSSSQNIISTSESNKFIEDESIDCDSVRLENFANIANELYSENREMKEELFNIFLDKHGGSREVTEICSLTVAGSYYSDKEFMKSLHGDCVSDPNDTAQRLVFTDSADPNPEISNTGFKIKSKEKEEERRRVAHFEGRNDLSIAPTRVSYIIPGNTSKSETILDAMQQNTDFINVDICP
jgi:hypothetical protein